RYADVVAQMNQLDQQQLATQQRDTTVNWFFRSWPMFSQAWTLYRLSLERPKTDLERVQGFQERDWPRIAEGVVRSQKSLEPQSDRAGLRYFLLESQKLPANQRIAPLDDLIARNGGVDKFLDQLYGNTKIADLALRKTMQTETTAQLQARHDAMIDFASALS